VELWISTSDATPAAVAAATVDLHYASDLLTALEILYGPAFTLDWTGTIDDAAGRVGEIGGRTELTDVGQDGYVLLARVRFASTGDDRAPVDPVERKIGPHDMRLTLANGQTVLVGGGSSVSELGEPPGTELWAVVYDIDENHRIDFGDLAFFAPAFGREVGQPGSEPPFVWWADFDKTGSVDYGDLSFLASVFGKSRSGAQSGQETIVFPPNFPDAWQGEQPSEPEGEGWSWESHVGWESPATLDRRIARFDSPKLSEVSPPDTIATIDEAHAMASNPSASLARQAPQRLTGRGRESLLDRRLSDALTLLDEPSTDGLLDDALPSVLDASDASGLPEECH
jgi:hypothetical protein